MLYSIYSITEGIPAALLSEIFLCPEIYTLTSEPTDADFFAYPTHYQVAYDYAPSDFVQHGVAADVQLLIRQRFTELDRLAAHYNKRIIAVYIRDNAQPLPQEHAIVFRTSLTASTRQRNEFAFPANGRPLNIERTDNPAYLPWVVQPAIGFRGQAAPMQLPWKLAVKNRINLSALESNFPAPLSIKYNFGYLQRRNALAYLLKDNQVHLDYKITTVADIFDADSRRRYASNLLQYPYALCVSGHGNYSFRLYETMEAGRIPLFVNTDCVLPLEELINYKALFVWVEDSEVRSIAKKLRQFHEHHRGDMFEKLQRDIQETWQTYLGKGQYYRHMPYYLKHFAVA